MSKVDKAELIGTYGRLQTSANKTAAESWGIPPENITVEFTRLGGGLEKDSLADYVRWGSSNLKITNAPVKVTGESEDDLNSEVYIGPGIDTAFERHLDMSQEIWIGYKIEKELGINSGNSNSTG